MNRNIFLSILKPALTAAFFAASLFFSAGTSYAGPSLLSMTGQYGFGPSITTARYGGSVVVTGNGFAKGELVDLSLESADSELNARIALWSTQIYADSSGGFETSLAIDSFVSPDGRLVIRALGNDTKSDTEVEISSLTGPSANLDQCANGSMSAPVNCSGANWRSGNVTQINGHYYEGDSIAYRIKFANLTVGGSNTVTIEWDTTQGGKHALDYLTSYDRTDVTPGNNPCSGIAGSHCANPPTVFPIPLDPNVSGAAITQMGGQAFKMWGGTITSVTGYTRTGSYTGNSSTRIRLTFTSNAANPVLAWGAHIADRNEWAAMGGSASSLSGSPYRTRLTEFNGACPNQDRALSCTAVRLASKIVIIKQANPETTLPFGFNFYDANSIVPFTLWDDGVDNDATPNNRTFTQPIAPGNLVYFDIIEDPAGDYYELQSLTCSTSLGGSSQAFPSLPARAVKIGLNYGDTVTCTFTNNVVTAANTSVGGRVTDPSGNPLGRSTVTIFNTATGETRRSITNQLGHYRFDDLAVGDFYVVTVSNRKYTFPDNTVSFTLNDAVDNLDFVSNAQ